MMPAAGPLLTPDLRQRDVELGRDILCQIRRDRLEQCDRRRAEVGDRENRGV
jgi:hypothetical protein